MTDFDEGGGGAPMSPAQLLQVAQRRATALTEPAVEDVESGGGESETIENPVAGRNGAGSGGGMELAMAPAPSPGALLRQKPGDTSDAVSMMAWMSAMIENQHKDIADLQSKASSAPAAGAAMPSGWATPGSGAHDVVSADDQAKSREELIEFIHQNPVFREAVSIDPEEKENFVEEIAGRLERRFYYKDSMIVKKGADATEMYFIYAGMAEVYLDHPDAAEESKIPPVARLKKGTFFGEAALLSEERTPRNAWIRANCDMEVYCLSADDLKHSLKEHPVMETMFNAEKHKRELQRKEHLERFETGGGNFRRGFKVRLRTLGTKEKLASMVTSELEEAFETVPEVFPRSAVEALLLDKVEALENVRDQLAAKGITEAHGHGKHHGKPMTEAEQKKTIYQMCLLALIFFSLCFIPFVSVQHHSEEMLLATSATHPAMLHLNYYSAYRIDTALTIEGQPPKLVKDAGEMHHGRRLQRAALPVCDDSCATANDGICQARDAAVGTEDCERPTSSRAQSSCAANTDSTDCGQCQPCRAPAGAPPPPPPPSPPSPPEGGEGGGGGLEPRGGPTRGSDFENDWRPPCRLADAVAIDLGFAPCAETVESWVRAYVVRADHHVAEKLAMGNLTAAEALLPTTPRDRGVGIIDESEGPIRVKDDIQTQFLSFPMEGNMAGIDEIEERVYLFVVTNSQDPIGMAVKVNDLGWTGPAEEFLAFCILVCVFAMIVFEVVHHTLAAMIGSYVVLLVLAMQHRMPDIAEVVSFMDHGTLALLWGMMIIVGVTAKTGVFEWMAVKLYVVSGGEPFKLLFWLCILDIVLSAFLDNVTTMLLLAPVSIQLCDAVGRDPRPFLISLALFGNVGGTMTMIGDPPNIIIGNMMKEFVTFNDFIVYLGPGVIISLPTSFWFTKWYFRAVLGDKMEVNLEQLEKDNSIRDHRLLIKTGIMLVAVIAGFFLHPVIHMDPVYVAVSGAIVIFALDNHHDLEEALEGVEWDTLIFFAALFVMVEGLAEMGLLRMIGNQLSEVVESFDPASRQANAIIIVSYVSAVTSAFVDNIPFTTTMIPIIKQIAEDVDGIRIEPLIWSLAFGSCLGGMGTLIGASDNVVMAGIAEKAGYHVSFMSFMRIGFPFMIQSVTITTVWMLFLNATGIWDDFTEGEYSQIVEESTPHG